MAQDKEVMERKKSWLFTNFNASAVNLKVAKTKGSEMRDLFADEVGGEDNLDKLIAEYEAAKK